MGFSSWDEHRTEYGCSPCCCAALCAVLCSAAVGLCVMWGAQLAVLWEWCSTWMGFGYSGQLSQRDEVMKTQHCC